MAERFTPPTGDGINKNTLIRLQIAAFGALNDNGRGLFQIFHARARMPNVLKIARNKVALRNHGQFFRLTITQVTLSCST